MLPYTDKIIETITKYLPKDENEWELVGFVNKKKEIYTFGSDSKIIGRLFEVIAFEALNNSAIELGYTLHESDQQTVYPDFYFVKPNGRKIAVDIKTTYRRSEKAKFGFTGGSFTSFMRNGTKNIVGNYSDYDGHYILGVVYTRETNPTTGKVAFENLDSIIPAYKNIEIFVQEKYRICGDKKGSGNTDNIGTITSASIKPFVYGAGPFSILGKDTFHDYWVNHPRYTDSKEKKQSLYNNIDTY
ncbi:type II restriction endonuclease, partial [Streptococcus canis]